VRQEDVFSFLFFFFFLESPCLEPAAGRKTGLAHVISGRFMRVLMEVQTLAQFGGCFPSWRVSVPWRTALPLTLY
jgi:hypothetical protein